MQDLLKKSNIKEKNQIYYSSQSEHVGKLTRSRKWSTKRRGEHHISTGHGPMVQGGLLTTHPGGVHGDGGSPGGGSSFQHSVGQLLLAAPILKRRRRRYREEFGNKRSILGVSSAGDKYRPKGAPTGATRQPGGMVAWPRVGTRQAPSWAPGGGPPAKSWLFRKLP